MLSTMMIALKAKFASILLKISTGPVCDQHIGGNVLIHLRIQLCEINTNPYLVWFNSVL